MKSISPKKFGISKLSIKSQAIQMTNLMFFYIFCLAKFLKNNLKFIYKKAEPFDK